jgi:pyrimidine oxygenase
VLSARLEKGTTSMASARRVQLGVFLPVGNGGWIASTTSPEIPATYRYNRAVTRLAEDLGLDFALSMAKWRGYGGPSRHWDFTLESLSTMAMLAEATTRIQLWATVHTMVWHPAVVAKMMATMDQAASGRIGLNLVSGSNPYDQGQMGLWRDLDHAQRYELADEWVTVVKKLWTQERTDHEGTYYRLTDCVSNPKPARPPTLICAGTSETGLRFAVKSCDVCFVSATSSAELGRTTSLIRSLGTEYGRKPQAFALLVVVPGRTDSEAQARVARYDAGVDVAALRRQASEYATDVSENSMRRRMLAVADQPHAVSRSAIAGSSDTIARRLAELVEQADLDGITLIVPDFIADLRTVGTEVAALLAERGVVTTAAETGQAPVGAGRAGEIRSGA